MQPIATNKKRYSYETKGKNYIAKILKQCKILENINEKQKNY
jgi:hypothetical protein